MTDPASLPWRTGRSLGRTVYARTGGGNWKDDTVIGMLDTRELAEAACAARNALLDLARLAEAGYDVCLSTRKAQGMPGVYVSLEHLDLDEPEEFYAPDFGGALATAREWAATEGAAP